MAPERARGWQAYLCESCSALGPDERDARRAESPHAGAELRAGVVKLVQKEGHTSVRVFRWPEKGAELVGEVPSGQLVRTSAKESNFMRVRWHNMDGWVGIKNISSENPVLRFDPQHGLSTQPEDRRSVRLRTRREPEESPRIRAAASTFKLHVDREAQDRWKKYAQHGPAAGDIQPDERALLEQARPAAGALNFLELTVKSQEELWTESKAKSKQLNLELYTPATAVPMNVKQSLLDAACKVPQAARSMGALVGLAVADSLGAPLEFCDAVDEPAVDEARFDLESFEYVGWHRNKFRLELGQWTDDTAMALCLADSLLARGAFDGSDARVRFHNWWFRGYNNAFGNDTRVGSVGLGGNVASSLRAMRPGERPPPQYEAVAEDAGNGSLMRLAPVPVFMAHDPVEAARASALSSAATHPGCIAAAACALLGFVVAKAITRGPAPGTAADFLDAAVQEFISLGMPKGMPGDRAAAPERRAAGEGGVLELEEAEPAEGRTLRARGERYNGYPCSAGYFGSYSVDGLAIAMWSFYHTGSFMEAIVRCANFCGDADTTAAICGQMAGAFYGYSAIDPRLIEHLERYDDKDIACRAVLLYVMRQQSCLEGAAPCPLSAG
eukprot:CAMPEP_0179309004 /NCGR_PEP_ID=MMETSP0797-20121207/51435_1 /TAXON_ID=47934 /ORGANISM="Dinophysis acuminata, Strain DAEP01" /LENGTH=613 /DNA_ID=CAMNT_0021018709 /DNA_START=228 /DNA_END=2066 /DNA_ORIENTATION=-